MEEIYNKAPAREECSLDLKTKSRQCFGSAGCNVTLEPNLSYLGPLPLDPDKTYSITYEVRGSEDGAIIQTMELTNQASWLRGRQPFPPSAWRRGRSGRPGSRPGQPVVCSRGLPHRT